MTPGMDLDWIGRRHRIAWHFHLLEPLRGRIRLRPLRVAWFILLVTWPYHLIGGPGRLFRHFLLRVVKLSMVGMIFFHIDVGTVCINFPHSFTYGHWIFWL